MDFSLSSDQLLIRDTVRQFMETEMRPILREYEREGRFPAEQLRKLGDLGCCGMLVPEEWGGAGTDTVSYALMLEEVARVCASTAVALSVTNSVVGIPIWKFGLSDNDTLRTEDLMRERELVWNGKLQRIRLDPELPFAIWRVA